MNKTIWLIISAFILLSIGQLKAQERKPVEWRTTVKMTSEKEGTVTFKANLESGWHLYGTNLPAGGPKPTVFDLSESTGVEFIGKITPAFKPVEVEDKMFGMKLNWWDRTVTFTCVFKVVDSAKARIRGKITYMACNNQTCMPPQVETFSKIVKYFKK